MCTAITYASGDHYFGRNLDLDHSYNETVTVAPRGFPFAFRRAATLKEHYAMIGMAFVVENYPLYYDATNEKGLSMAGLNFPASAFYGPEKDGPDNISPFEFIPWLLGQCANLAEARKLLARIHLVNIPFSARLPLSPLHWLIADQTGAIVVEAMREGLKIYEDPVGVLTNEPPFDYQMFHLNNHMQLTREAPRNSFAEGLSLKPYCLGMGALACRETCPRPRASCVRRSQSSTPFPAPQKRRASASFSTSSVPWRRRAAAPAPRTTASRSQSIPPAVTWTGASTTTPLTKTVASRRWTCTKRTSTARRLSAIL